MKPIFFFGSVALMLTACGTPVPTLTDDQVTQRIHNWRQVEDCNKRGYFTSREHAVVLNTHQTSVAGQDQSRVDRLAGANPHTPALPGSMCQKMQKYAAQEISKIDNPAVKTSTTCIPQGVSGQVYCF